MVEGGRLKAPDENVMITKEYEMKCKICAGVAGDLQRVDDGILFLPKHFCSAKTFSSQQSQVKNSVSTTAGRGR